MKTVLFLLIGAVLVGGLAVFGLFGGNLETKDKINEESGVEVGQQEESAELKSYAGTGTLTELQNLGANLECQISYNAPELQSPVEGTYFVAGTNVRGDFVLEIPELGGTSVSSIIFTDEMFYSWSEIAGQTYGVKISIDTMSQMDEADTREPIPSDVDLSYNCVEWKDVDYSIFQPPSQVLFQDMSSLLEGGMEYGTIYNEGEF